MDRLYDKLITYSSKNYYPMHMPGHKRNLTMLPMGNPYEIDITEIEGFDNLHQAQGIIKKLSSRISRLYGARSSYPLINGSTAGILAGISAATKKGDKILLARNSHKSVYHGTVLGDLIPIYCYPHQIEDTGIYGGISPDVIDKLLITHKNIRLVVITSPTYEGMVSDIRSIADVAHRHGALLLVDEAHGAHLGFHKGFPESAVRLGADIVIQSLHKTLPSFTQTAILHLNREELRSKIEKYLAIYQSSSPSYLLMAGIDRCISLLEDHAGELFELYYNHLTDLIEDLQGLKHLSLIGKEMIGKFDIYDKDTSKLIVSLKGTGLSGPWLQDQLRQRYRIVMELESANYILGITGIADTKEGLDCFRDAILDIDKGLSRRDKIQKEEDQCRIKPQQVLIPSIAMEQLTTEVKLTSSVGKIAGTYVTLYPPGSPLLVPGEIIDEELLQYIIRMKHLGITVTGLSGEQEDEIEIIV